MEFFRLSVALLLVAYAGVTVGQGAFVVGSQGCPMAHCDERMSDSVGFPVPTGQVGVVWRRDRTKGSLSGIGCASNGSVVACTFTGVRDNLVVYDEDGTRLWSSGNHLGLFAVASAPIVAEDGSVIAADGSRIIRFDPQGEVVWEAATPGGIPLSPVITSDGFVVIATYLGPVSAYTVDSGAFVGALYLGRELGAAGPFFHTLNTPAVRDNRVYVVAEKTGGNSDHEGRLFAIDVSGSGLSEAWYFDFGSSSGASPLAIDDVIYFDGDRPAAGPMVPRSPTVFAVQDTGASGELVWTHTVPSGASIPASMAQDPRGGLWYFGFRKPQIVRLDAAIGEVIEQINVDALVAGIAEHVPLSVMTITESMGAPVMLVSALTTFGFQYLLAINLEDASLLWKVPIVFAVPWNFGGPVGQYPIIMSEMGPRIVFSTWDDGVFAVGDLVEANP